MKPALTVIFLILGLANSQNEFRGRRRKVVRTRPRPSRIEDLAPVGPAAPAPVAPVAPALPPPPPQAQAPPTGVLITDIQCPELEGLQLYPKEDSCNQFYKCANGTLTLETCGNGLLYDEARGQAGAAHNHCSYNWEADCGQRPVDDTPISSPGCEYQFGIFPSGEGCFASYTKCAGGVPKEVYCQLGLAYDHRIHTCNWPDLLMEYAGCNPSAALGDFRCPSNEELSPLAQRFFPFPRFPVAKDPKLYIICVDGVPRLNTCTAGTLFSEATLSCEEQS